MRTISYTESRRRYAEVLGSVTDDREEVIVTRAGHEPVVMVALDEYNALLETAHLMRSPANAERVLAAIQRLDAGEGQEHPMVETD